MEERRGARISFKCQLSLCNLLVLREHKVLSSNCSAYRPNNGINIQRYCTVICTVQNPLDVQVGSRT